MRIALVAGFFLLLALLAAGLTLKPREVPSPLLGTPAPAFELPKLGAAGAARFSPAEMRGKVWLLNVWASWCVSCRDEHPVLVEFAKTGRAPLVGLNYKDRGEDALKWLAHYGDPYTLSAVDADGRIGIDYGVYGVPETYVIDKAGVIRYKQIGPVTPAIMEGKILPLLKELER
jgi:cytochrome c biogenesis protein CcmG/thiol:disulfide interchange protein DsbE